MKRVVLVAGLISFFTGHNALTQEMRAILPSDCVTVRKLPGGIVSSAIAISPHGDKIAYLVEAPNLQTNRNDTELYIKMLNDKSPRAGRLLLKGDLSSIQWLGANTKLAIVSNERGDYKVEEIDTVTGVATVAASVKDKITEYSIDNDARTIVIAVQVAAPKATPSPVEKASGYRIPFQEKDAAAFSVKRLYVVRRSRSVWTKPKPLEIKSPFTGTRLDGFVNPNLYLSLSPNGTRLLFQYTSNLDDLPIEWAASPYVQWVRKISSRPVLLAMYNLQNGETSVPFRLTSAYDVPLWSADSGSFLVTAHSPVGGAMEEEDAKEYGAALHTIEHLFRVDLDAHNLEKVVPFARLRSQHSKPLAWTDQGVFVETSSNTVGVFSRRNETWSENHTIHIPVPRTGLGSIVSNGQYVVGTVEDTVTPPEMFTYQDGERQVSYIVKLDPQFDHLSIAKPLEVHWTTSTGFKAAGLLLLPPDYVAGHKYPLVIHTKPFGHSFVCGYGNFPSFAPQPIANAGILYLGQVGEDMPSQHDVDYFPKGYPGVQGYGGVSEAAFQMDLWNSAVKSLDEQGLVDPSKVGIIGYSRSGWFTEFILSHSKLHYRAATVADNIQYSLGEYWLYHRSDVIREFDAMYGGPPYGATLKNYLDYSVSFNLEKIRTPLLMEMMGYGKTYDDRLSVPIGLAGSFEVFTGLSRLNKPVDLFFYPTEDHQPDHPRARLGTLQRNVDWFRFWLQGYERPNPEDPTQYIRWEHLRDLQDADDRQSKEAPSVPSAVTIR